MSETRGPRGTKRLAPLRLEDDIDGSGASSRAAGSSAGPTGKEAPGKGHTAPYRLDAGPTSAAPRQTTAPLPLPRLPAPDRPPPAPGAPDIGAQATPGEPASAAPPVKDAGTAAGDAPAPFDDDESIAGVPRKTPPGKVLALALALGVFLVLSAAAALFNLRTPAPAADVPVPVAPASSVSPPATPAVCVGCNAPGTVCVSGECALEPGRAWGVALQQVSLSPKLALSMPAPGPFGGRGVQLCIRTTASPTWVCSPVLPAASFTSSPGGRTANLVNAQRPGATLTTEALSATGLDLQVRVDGHVIAEPKQLRPAVGSLVVNARLFSDGLMLPIQDGKVEQIVVEVRPSP